MGQNFDWGVLRVGKSIPWEGCMNAPKLVMKRTRTSLVGSRFVCRRVGRRSLRIRAWERWFVPNWIS